MELNVSHSIEKHSDNIKEELGETIKELSSVESSVIDLIKEMKPSQVAKVLETNYMNKKPEDLAWDHGHAAMVQTAISLIENERFKDDAEYQPLMIDGVYGAKTKGAVTMFQLENGLNGQGRAGPNTIAALVKKLREMDGGTRPAPTPVDYDNSKVVENSAIEKKMKVTYNSKLDDFKNSNDLVKYRANEKIPAGTFSGASANLNGKGIGEVLAAIHDKEGLGSGAIVAKDMEVLYQYDKGRDPLLYAYSLRNAMEGFGTTESIVSGAMSRGNKFKILDKIFDSFGVQHKKNLVQFIASDFIHSTEWRSSISTYFKNLAASGEKPKTAVKELLLSDGYVLSPEVRNDKQFAAFMGLIYTDIGGWKERAEQEKV